MVDFSKTGQVKINILILFENNVRLPLSKRNRAHLHGTFLKYHGFYTFLGHRNVEQLIFIFFSESFLTDSNRTLGFNKLPNSSQQRKISEWLRNLFILTETFWQIISIHFGCRQLPVSLKIMTAAFMIRKTLVITRKRWSSNQQIYWGFIHQIPFEGRFRRILLPRRHLLPLITRLIVIDIVPLKVLFCNCLLADL